MGRSVGGRERGRERRREVELRKRVKRYFEGVRRLLGW